MAIGARILALEENLREARDGYAYQASHDPLTGLLNRLAITNHVDHFKQVNDTYGHLVGDQALVDVAEILTHVVRPYDRVGRWGGEEFLVVLANTTLEDALIVAERLRSQIAATPVAHPPTDAVPLTVSIGVASTGVPVSRDSDPVVLFQQADAALYAAKTAGRNCIRWHGNTA